MGAIGASYANQISKHCENKDVQLYCVVSDLKKYDNKPIYINGDLLQVKYYSYEMMKDIPLDLIMIAVKSYHFEKVICAMEHMVGKETLILSLLNGVQSEEKLIEKFGEAAVLHSTILGADTHKSNQTVCASHLGIIVFGDATGEISEKALRVKLCFDNCGIAYELSKDIVTQLWKKLLVNVGCNQVSTLYELTYEKLRTDEKAMELMRKVQREVIEVAKGSNILIEEEDIQRWEDGLQKLSPQGRSSMLQDYWLNNPLELDIMGEYIYKVGQNMGIDVPMNRWIVEEIKKKVERRGIDEQRAGRNELGAEMEGRMENKRRSVEKIEMITAEKIADQLRMDILRKKLLPGEKISENQLAKQFGSNRSVVRNALQILSNDGVILTHMNGRREVVEFGIKQVKELYDFRRLIEEQALISIMTENKANTSMFPRLAKVLSEIEKCCEMEVENVDWYDLDVRFHRELVATSNNLFLKNAWESSVNITYALMNFNVLTGYKERYAREFFEKHQHLYKLMITNDVDCEDALEKHIIDAEEIALSVMSSVGIDKITKKERKNI